MSNTESSKHLFNEISNLATEQRNPISMNIDAMSVKDILALINSEDKTVAFAIEKELEPISKAVELIVSSLKHGGRLLYFGAGTSGRLGVLDAAECPPTFGTPHELILGSIAGGKEAMFRAQEGAEDKEENGANDVSALKVTSNDVVCGIAASSRTPYAIGAVKKAKELGASTIFITCSSKDNFSLDCVDVPICVPVGPEVIMGSTRMKSGTAQKMILNLLTTTTMIRLGKVYENLMIDLQMTNSKLVERSKRIVMIITGVSYEEATAYLEKSGWHIKSALVMIKSGVGFEEAKQRLVAADGFVRAAIEGKKT